MPARFLMTLVIIAACLCEGRALIAGAWGSGPVLEASAPLKPQLAVAQGVPVVRGMLVGSSSALVHDRLLPGSGLAARMAKPVESLPPVDAFARVDGPLRIAHPPQGPPGGA